MKQLFVLFLLNGLLILSSCAQNKSTEAEVLTDLPPVITNPENYNELSEFEAYVIREEGTERAFTGAYYDLKEEGLYICRQCNNPLYHSSDKFNSGTGWPSFDDYIEGAVKKVPDGSRTEIVCANCGGHLGHVFKGEGFTERNIRHCVNSVSLTFVAEEEEAEMQQKGVMPIDEYIEGKGYDQYEAATFAGGCFWCTEASFDQIEGVKEVISGYSGGEKAYPTYEEVAGGKTKYAESIMIYYDPQVITYETLLDIFFVAHNPTTLNRQGPDVGPQYRSAIFYHDESQKEQARSFIDKLESLGVYDDPIVTKISPYEEFWVAEAYHQNYYDLHPDSRYIQNVSKPKVEKVKKEFEDKLKNEK